MMHKQDSWIGLTTGAIGGWCKFHSLAQINTTFSSKLIESLIIAVLCALAGLIVKDVYVWSKNKFFK